MMLREGGRDWWAKTAAIAHRRMEGNSARFDLPGGWISRVQFIGYQLVIFTSHCLRRVTVTQMI